MLSYIPRQAAEHWRTTGKIMNIIVDYTVERVKGGKLDRCNVTICRYNNNDADDHDWIPACYKDVSGATRRRLLALAPRAAGNRKARV